MLSQKTLEMTQHLFELKLKHMEYASNHYADQYISRCIRDEIELVKGYLLEIEYELDKVKYKQKIERIKKYKFDMWKNCIYPQQQNEDDIPF